MSEVFGAGYAAGYDDIYREKDYAAECDLIEGLLRDHDGRVRRVLDLGCGTGGHAIPLARRGYEVVGVDRSAAMLRLARDKAADPAGGGHCEFRLADVRELDLNRTFDAALMMFAVLGYQLENTDVLAALKTVRRHLRPRGVLLFDVWYGPAVLKEGPSRRRRIIETTTGRIQRTAFGSLDVRRHVCHVQIQVARSCNGRPAEETSEQHDVRFFFPMELDLFLQCAGLRLLDLTGFPEVDRRPDETTWNVLGRAVAVS